MKPDEQKRIEDMKLRTTLLDYLKNHKSTANWVNICETGHTMDVPMMVVEAMMDLVGEVKFETQNALQDKFDEGYTHRMEDEKKIDNLTSL